MGAATGAREPARRRELSVVAAGFELDALLVMATVAPRDLVKTLMDIDWAPDTAGKVAQLDERLVAVRAVEDAARERIVSSPELAGKPLPPVPPPAVMREFTLVMAARTAIEKLEATRAALAKRI